jgi:hypothetical protein
MFVNAGFIIGFDAEKGPVAEAMIRCIEDAAIPVCMTGFLYALPSTRLWHRLTNEGRLHAESDRPRSDRDADQCTSGLNFATLRPRREIMEDLRTVLKRIYEPRAFFARVERMAAQLDLSEHKLNRPTLRTLRDLRSFARIVWRSGILDRQVRGPFWRTIGRCLVSNPRAVRAVVSLAALYLHLQPYARFMDAHVAERIEATDTMEPRSQRWPSHPIPKSSLQKVQSAELLPTSAPE